MKEPPYTSPSIQEPYTWLRFQKEPYNTHERALVYPKRDLLTPGCAQGSARDYYLVYYLVLVKNFFLHAWLRAGKRALDPHPRA